MPAQQFSADIAQGSSGFPFVQVGDLSRQLGKPHELVRHSSAFKINDKEAQQRRRVMKRAADQQGLQQLALSGSCGAGDQAVRPVMGFVQIDG